MIKKKLFGKLEDFIYFFVKLIIKKWNYIIESTQKGSVNSAYF